MKHGENSIAGRLGFLAAVLLLPGGLLLLAWAVLVRGNRDWRAAGWLPVLVVLGTLQGCATQLDMRAASRPGDTETAVLQFQRPSIAPAIDEKLVTRHDLAPGDILLTAARTFRSSAIQVMTLAPVSHAAVYLGNGKVAEAAAPEIRIRSLDDLLADEIVVVAFRHPDLTTEQARGIRAYALEREGASFNFFGVAMHIPFGVTRKVCEVPLMPSLVRDACTRSLGGVLHIATSSERAFCSQFVLKAYEYAGLSMTDADPRLISPADILHMREGDVPAFRTHRPLRQVGYLKYDRLIVAADHHQAQ